MNTNTKNRFSLKFVLIAVWLINCLVCGIIAIHNVWLPSMDAKDQTYQHIQSDPFDGTVLPMSHIPNWNKIKYRDKSIHFRDVATRDLMPLPRYNINALQDENNLFLRYTYTVPYMGSYTLNYKEYDGSHLGVDIRAVTGTPVLAIANGVVVRSVTSEKGGNQFVVIRHDNVPLNGQTTTLFSSYLHLSEVFVSAGTKIRKGETLGLVGSTGLSTAPHLHFQIDTEEAPFHPYWPFSSSEARANNMNTFQAISAGLGREKAEKYTINPMNFVQHYIGGAETKIYTENKPQNNTPLKTLEEIAQFQNISETATEHTELEDIISFEPKKENLVVASHIAYNPDCQFGNIPNSPFGRKLAELSRKHCLFAYMNTVNEKATVTRAEALMALMKFYHEEPQTGVSHFLDIPLSQNILQGYALTAYQKGIFRGQYLRPEKNLTKGEFIEILARFHKIKTAPKNYVAYNDVSKKSTLYNSIQNYGYTIGAKNIALNADKILTQNDLVEILQNLEK